MASSPSLCREAYEKMSPVNEHVPYYAGSMGGTDINVECPRRFTCVPGRRIEIYLHFLISFRRIPSLFGIIQRLKNMDTVTATGFTAPVYRAKVPDTEPPQSKSIRERMLANLNGQTLCVPDISKLMQGWPQDLSPHASAIDARVLQMIKTWVESLSCASH